MKVIQVQFTVGDRSYQVVGIADSTDAVIAALEAQSAGIAIDNMGAEVLWDSEHGFTYSAVAPLLTCAQNGADAGWLRSLIAPIQ